MRATRRLVAVILGLAMLLACAGPASAQTGEKKVKLDEVPAAVKTAIREAVGDGKLVDIGTYSLEGKTVYEIEMVVANEEYDVLFAEDGTVLRKSFEGVKTSQPEKTTAAEKSASFQDDFFLEERKLATTGRNRFFVLEPGYQLVLEGKEGDHVVNLTVTVLDQTRKIGGFDTRVVEERESVDGELKEISRNFFAMCTETKSVFYFGEEVDIYAGGKVVGHEGAWIHGEKGARAGMMMPGEPLLGAAYYQEIAPGEAMDRARIAATNETLATPSGIYKGCLKVQEENPLDQEKEFKIHAPGIGLIQDENLLLLRHGFVEKRK